MFITDAQVHIWELSTPQRPWPSPPPPAPAAPAAAVF